MKTINCNLCYCPGQKTQHPFNLHCFVYLHGLLIDSCNKKYAHNDLLAKVAGWRRPKGNPVSRYSPKRDYSGMEATSKMDYTTLKTDYRTLSKMH